MSSFILLLILLLFFVFRERLIDDHRDQVSTIKTAEF